MARKTREPQVHDRVKRLREALGVQSQQAMAVWLGVSFNRYNNVERGLPLSHDLAVLLCRKVPGLTLDWLYFGRANGMSLDLAQKLGEAPLPAPPVPAQSLSPLATKRK